VAVFGLPVWGALLLFTLSGAFAALAGIGIGVMVATVSKSQQQAQLLRFFVNLPITLLSGSTSPIENMPDFFQKLSYLDPLRYLVTICSQCDIEGRTMERTVAQFGRPGDLCNHPVRYQRMALPKAVRRLRFQ
jgi:ABC-2 type transport system permease protein